MTIKTILAEATIHLNSDEAKLEAQLLLQHALNVNRAWLIAHEHENLPPSIHRAYRAMLKRRLDSEPIAYILGYREFYGLKLKVSVDTLIPRADTETLVEAALAKIDLLHCPSPQPSPTGGEGVHAANLSHLASNDEGVKKLVDSSASPLPLRERARDRGESNLERPMDSCLRGNDRLKVLDLGTGTGAIALAIAKHRPNALITALDASQAALDIAIENAHNLKITNVNFVFSDWFSAIQNETFDMIASNPPYIEAADAHLKQGDLRFEPIAALASGVDGLDAIRSIITQAPQHLNPHGWLLLEHGYNQAEVVTALLKQAGFSQIETHQDLGGNNRVTLGCYGTVGGA